MEGLQLLRPFSDRIIVAEFGEQAVRQRDPLTRARISQRSPHNLCDVVGEDIRRIIIGDRREYGLEGRCGIQACFEVLGF